MMREKNLDTAPPLSGGCGCSSVEGDAPGSSNNDAGTSGRGGNEGCCEGIGLAITDPIDAGLEVVDRRSMLMLVRGVDVFSTLTLVRGVVADDGDGTVDGTVDDVEPKPGMGLVDDEEKRDEKRPGLVERCLVVAEAVS